MKKLTYILMTVCLTMGMMSCDDFLEVNSPDQLTSSTYWRSKSDVESALSSAYSQLYLMGYSGDEWTLAEVKWPVEAYREDIIKIGSDAMNYPNWVDLYNFTYTNGNSQFSAYWRNYYRGISFCNEIIDKTATMTDDAIDATTKNSLLAEAHFLRAYYHMQLLLNWQKIIIRDTYITSGDASALDKATSSRAETWDFIIKDLNIATSLPQTREAADMGRATSGAAYAYLGWAYLERAYEETDKKSEYLANAVTAFDNVKGYELESDFKGMFDGTKKNCKESIFELQFSLDDSNGAVYRTQLHRWIASPDLDGWSEIFPSDALMKEYEKEGETSTLGMYDSRMYATLFFKCDYFNDPSGRVYGKTFDETFSSSDPSFRKFLPATKAALDLDETDVNIPLMRYSNVLLMKAEALNAQGHPEQAIPLINQVRNVHGNMPAMTGTTAAEVQTQIEHERILEFPLENFRWYDLRRWNKTTEALKAAGRTGFDASQNLFYPIPQTELNSNKLAGN
jgi:hypothetical protein